MRFALFHLVRVGMCLSWYYNHRILLQKRRYMYKKSIRCSYCHNMMRAVSEITNDIVTSHSHRVTVTPLDVPSHATHQRKSRVAALKLPEIIGFFCFPRHTACFSPHIFHVILSFHIYIYIKFRSTSFHNSCVLFCMYIYNYTDFSRFCDLFFL